MRKRLLVSLIAVFVPLLIGLAWWMSEQSFALSMRREQERAQLTETMIAFEVKNAVASLNYNDLTQAAQQYRAAYAAQGVDLLFCYNGLPLGGATLPTRQYEGLLAGGRCALLDTLSRPQRYAVAEPVSRQLTLIMLRDVSDLYALRAALQRAFLLCALLGVALILIASAVIAGWFTRPVSRLSAAALALERRAEPPHALPTQRKDELGGLARSFEAMQRAVLAREETLRHVADERQQLLDALAHELRTPLCALLGDARLLQQPLSQAERASIAEGMVREIKRLSDMDGQLMKLLRLRTEPLEMEEIDVRALLLETAERLRAQAGDVLLTVADAQSQIIGDRALLSILADNLAVNALRASSPGQSVTLTALPNGFSVRDRGIGMTDEQIAHAFEPFYKADKARTRSLGGAGLGLTLCRRIAERHEGELTLVSTPGAGTSATFTTLLHSGADSVTSVAVCYAQEVSHP